MQEKKPSGKTTESTLLSISEVESSRFLLSSKMRLLTNQKTKCSKLSKEAASQPNISSDFFSKRTARKSKTAGPSLNLKFNNKKFTGPRFLKEKATFSPPIKNETVDDFGADCELSLSQVSIYEENIKELNFSQTSRISSQTGKKSFFSQTKIISYSGENEYLQFQLKFDDGNSNFTRKIRILRRIDEKKISTEFSVLAEKDEGKECKSVMIDEDVYEKIFSLVQWEKEKENEEDLMIDYEDFILSLFPKKKIPNFSLFSQFRMIENILM